MYEYYIFFKSTPELTNVWTVGQKIWLRDAEFDIQNASGFFFIKRNN
jgi:hypothetical protein